MDKVFKWRNSIISYSKSGEGTNSIIAFHGYGQNRLSYHDLISEIPSDYQLFAVDLPFHGKTEWNEDIGISKADMRVFCEDFLNHINASEKITFMAYSIGGNFALSFVFAFPEKVQQLILIAADGLKFKPGFHFITQTRLGSLVFKGFVNFPQPVYLLLKIAKLLKIYPNKLYQFFKSSIKTKDLRKAIYLRWKSTSRIQEPMNKVVASLNHNNISTLLLFGRYDKIIPLSNAERIHKKLINSELIVLEEGHQILHSNTFQIIGKKL